MTASPINQDSLNEWVLLESFPVGHPAQLPTQDTWSSVIAGPFLRILSWSSATASAAAPISKAAFPGTSFLVLKQGSDAKKVSVRDGKVVQKTVQPQSQFQVAWEQGRHYTQQLGLLLQAVWRDCFYGMVGLSVGVWVGNKWPFEKNFWAVLKLSRLPHATAGHCYQEPVMPYFHRFLWWCLPSMGRFFFPTSLAAKSVHTRVDRIINRRGFSVGYCFALRSPLWASYILTASGCRLSAEQPEKRPSFVQDRIIPRRYRVDGGLFRDSGYDRGHLAPKASVGFSRGASEDSFYLSNVMVQDAVLNRGLWKDLEKLARIWTERHSAGDGSMAVCVGPVFEENTFGARFLHYNDEGKPDCSTKRLVNGQTSSNSSNNRRGFSFFRRQQQESDHTTGGIPSGDPHQGKTASKAEFDTHEKALPKAHSVVRVPDFLFMALQDCQSGKGVGFLVPNKTLRVHKDLMEGKAVGVSGKNADSLRYQSYIRSQMVSIAHLERSIRGLTGCGDGYKAGQTQSNFHLFQTLPSQWRVDQHSQQRDEVDFKHWAFPSEVGSNKNGK